MKSIEQFILIIFTLISLRCGIYSNTSEMSTNSISISRIQNNTKTHSPTIDYEITKKLEDKLSQQVDLQLVEKEGDLEMSGSITDYSVKPFSIGANKIVYQNRVTIKLEIKLINQLEQGKIIQKSISTFIDYNAQRNFGTVKDSLNNLLAIKIAEEIYNQFHNSW